MLDAIIITPVKDSLETTKKTVEGISKANGNFKYFVYNDFSGKETTTYLEKASKKFGFEHVNLSDITDTPSPNYKLVLEKAQQSALANSCPLVIVESDVIVKENTFRELLTILDTHPNPGIVGAITVDREGNYNFPYTFEKEKSSDVLDTNHSLSFCCTLMSTDFLSTFDFKELSQKKDWYDVFISRQSKKLGYSNYLAKGTEVLHLPHSSRPWKNLKYTNPVLYYWKKLVNKRDRI